MPTTLPGWKDQSYNEHLVWADCILFDTTSLAQKAKVPTIHWLGRERVWDFNPGAARAIGDPLLLRYETYKLGRKQAAIRGVPRWYRNGKGIVLKEWGSL